MEKQQNPQKFVMFKKTSFATYEEAKAKAGESKAPKVRIRRRSDETFDVCESKEIPKEG
jgi:hypothetical protein